MGDDREDLLGDIEADEEPAPSRFHISMRGKMALVGLAYFSVAILLLAATHSGTVDAYKRLHGTDVLEPSPNETVPAETEAPGTKFNYTGVSVFVFENFHAIGTGECFVQQIPAYKRETDIYYYDGLARGYLYLNVTEDWSNQEACSILMYTYDDFLPPVGLQARLRCSDENGLQGGSGRGHRSWGFGERGPRFESFSPDSDEPLPGFWATSGREDQVTRTPITGVDMTQWHDYTILWERTRATFLVDGLVVAEIDQAPTDPMAAVCFLSNAFYRTDGSGDAGHWVLDGGFLDLGLSESMAIDYLCLAELGLWDQEDGFGPLVAEMYS